MHLSGLIHHDNSNREKLSKDVLLSHKHTGFVMSSDWDSQAGTGPLARVTVATRNDMLIVNADLSTCLKLDLFFFTELTFKKVK